MATSSRARSRTGGCRAATLGARHPPHRRPHRAPLRPSGRRSGSSPPPTPRSGGPFRRSPDCACPTPPPGLISIAPGARRSAAPAAPACLRGGARTGPARGDPRARAGLARGRSRSAVRRRCGPVALLVRGGVSCLVLSLLRSVRARSLASASRPRRAASVVGRRAPRPCAAAASRCRSCGSCRPASGPWGACAGSGAEWCGPRLGLPGRGPFFRRPHPRRDGSGRPAPALEAGPAARVALHTRNTPDARRAVVRSRRPRPAGGEPKQVPPPRLALHRPKN